MSAAPLVPLAQSDGRRPLVFDWGASSFSGWGINGLNFILSLSTHPLLAPICARPFSLGDVVLDPLRGHAVAVCHSLSGGLRTVLSSLTAACAVLDAPLLTALGNDLVRHSPVRPTLGGRPSIGMVSLDHSKLSPEGLQRAQQFALLVTGSSWNEAVLRANGVIATTTVIQGVDTSLFHPAPASRRFPDRFVVFSGGKLAYRGGQDLVVRAFRLFHQRHPSALLIAAWHTPWASHDREMAGATGTATAEPDANGDVDTARWAIENGAPADALVALGRTPNIAMPHVLREADVALFPSRCEARANRAAMECMACGIPVVLSANTGHLDLLALGDGAFRLTRQTPPSVPGIDTQEWGESDVEEIVEMLETVWRDRQAATARGLRGARQIAGHTSQRQTDRLLRAIDPFLP